MVLSGDPVAMQAALVALVDVYCILCSPLPSDECRSRCQARILIAWPKASTWLLLDDQCVLIPTLGLEGTVAQLFYLL